MPASARFLVVATFLGGAALLALSALRLDHLSLGTMSLLAVAVILTELMQVPGGDETAGPGDANPFSFSAGVHLAAIVLVGPWGASLVAALGVVLVDRFRGAAWRAIAFNAGAFVFSSVAGGYAFVAAGGTPGSLALPRDLLALVTAAVLAYGVTTVLVSAVVALASRRRVVPLIAETLGGQVLSATGEAGFGIALAVLLLREPWAAVALGPLVFGLYKAHAGLAMHRRETARALETFANVVDERDAFTSDHSARVAELAGELAVALGYSARDVARIRWAGRLHDLGKIIVDTSVLHKKEPLSDAEWAVLRRHPRLSARLLRRFQLAADEARAVEHHHERFDGGGYYRVDRRDLSLAAHLLIVADAFDAMTSDRPYRQGLGTERALQEIERGRGTQFHPIVAKAFIAQQRGVAPVVALSASERAELGPLWPPRRARHLAALRRAAEPRSAYLGGLVGGFALLGVGAVVPAVGLFVAALACLVRDRLEAARVDRLSASIRSALAGDQDGTAGVARLVALLLEQAGTRWAGLVVRESPDCGHLARHWGEGAAPDAAPLVRWLGRELDSGEELLVCDGWALGWHGVFVALPLDHGTSSLTDLVLRFDGPPPRATERALRRVAGSVRGALGGAIDTPPAPQTLVAAA